MTNTDPSQKAEIIDHIYDVALDPERYEQLLDAWEKRMHPLRGVQPQFGPDAGQSEPALGLSSIRSIVSLVATK